MKTVPSPAAFAGGLLKNMVPQNLRTRAHTSTTLKPTQTGALEGVSIRRERETIYITSLPNPAVRGNPGLVALPLSQTPEADPTN